MEQLEGGKLPSALIYVLFSMGFCSALHGFRRLLPAFNHASTGQPLAIAPHVAALRSNTQHHGKRHGVSASTTELDQASEASTAASVVFDFGYQRVVRVRWPCSPDVQAPQRQSACSSYMECRHGRIVITYSSPAACWHTAHRCPHRHAKGILTSAAPLPPEDLQHGGGGRRGVEGDVNGRLGVVLAHLLLCFRDADMYA